MTKKEAAEGLYLLRKDIISIYKDVRYVATLDFAIRSLANCVEPYEIQVGDAVFANIHQVAEDKDVDRKMIVTSIHEVGGGVRCFSGVLDDGTVCSYISERYIRYAGAHYPIKNILEAMIE